MMSSFAKRVAMAEADNFTPDEIKELEAQCAIRKYSKLVNDVTLCDHVYYAVERNKKLEERNRFLVDLSSEDVAKLVTKTYFRELDDNLATISRILVRIICKVENKTPEATVNKNDCFDFKFANGTLYAIPKELLQSALRE